MYRIDFSPRALDQLKALRKYDQQRILIEIQHQLSHEPDVPSRRRKLIEDLEAPWGLPYWQLTVGQFRVFYDVSEVEPSDEEEPKKKGGELDGEVSILAIRKKGSHKQTKDILQ